MPVLQHKIAGGFQDGLVKATAPKLRLDLQSSRSLSSSSLRMAAAFSNSSRRAWFFFSRTSLDFLCTSANFPVGSGLGGFSFSMYLRMTQTARIKDFNFWCQRRKQKHHH